MTAERFAIIGHPVAHSLSPAMHSAAFQAAGIDGVFEAHDVHPGSLRAHLGHLRRGYAGFNVTVPHKEAVIRMIDWAASEVQAIGAVNTVAVREGTLSGFNTDAPGFLAALRAIGFDPSRKDVVVLGAGGSSRAIVHALRGRGARITVVGRTLARTSSAFAAHAGSVTVTSMNTPELGLLLAHAELIVNATPLGMEHLAEQSPLPAHCELSAGAVAFDLVYGRDTPFLRQARDCGCTAVDGLEMLVQQGAAAFHLWTDVKPDLPIMRAACLRALKEQICSVS